MTKEKIITKDLTIGEVVQKHPEIIPVLMEHGIHCVGCHVAAFESLGQGFAGHGYSEKQVEEIIEKLNEAVKKEKNKK